MKYSAQELLLADRLLVLAESRKETDAALRFPFGSDLRNCDIQEKRSAWVQEQSHSEYVLKILAELEDVAAIVTEQP